MWCVVGEVQKERLVRPLRPITNVVRGPVGKEVGRMSLRLDGFPIAAHVVVAMTQMIDIAVHHVAQKSMKEIEAAFIGSVRRFQSQMPLADNRRVIAGFLQLVRESGHGRIEVAPRVFRVGANHTGNTDTILIPTREQCGARG